MGVRPCLVEGVSTLADDLAGDGVFDEPRRRVDGVSEEDTLLGFGREFGAMGRVDIDVDEAAEDAEVE